MKRYLLDTGIMGDFIDMQLAAIAFALGNCSVVTKDGDLSAVPGLQLENWATA
ncbi:MAG: type II toxin-antitoxin system VapC family toxin [Isosphaeraceae bacterium]